MFDRNRQLRFVHAIVAYPDEATALGRIRGELDPVLEPVTKARDREQPYRSVYSTLAHGEFPARSGLQRDDIIGRHSDILHRALRDIARGHTALTEQSSNAGDPHLKFPRRGAAVYRWLPLGEVCRRQSVVGRSRTHEPWSDPGGSSNSVGGMKAGFTAPSDASVQREPELSRSRLGVKMRARIVACRHARKHGDEAPNRPSQSLDLPRCVMRDIHRGLAAWTS